LAISQATSRSDGYSPADLPAVADDRQTNPARGLVEVVDGSCRGGSARSQLGACGGEAVAREQLDGAPPRAAPAGPRAASLRPRVVITIRRPLRRTRHSRVTRPCSSCSRATLARRLGGPSWPRTRAPRRPSPQTRRSRDSSRAAGRRAAGRCWSPPKAWHCTTTSCVTGRARSEDETAACIRARLAIACAASGQLDRARAEGRKALTTARVMRSATAARQLRQLHDLLRS
jgi:hypothetical protein